MSTTTEPRKNLFEVGKCYAIFHNEMYPEYFKVHSIEWIESQQEFKYTVDYCHAYSEKMYGFEANRNRVFFLKFELEGTEIPREVFDQTMDAFEKIKRAKNIYDTAVKSIKKEILWTDIGYPDVKKLRPIT